jgi:hypothetical protein
MAADDSTGRLAGAAQQFHPAVGTAWRAKLLPRVHASHELPKQFYLCR